MARRQSLILCADLGLSAECRWCWVGALLYFFVLPGQFRLQLPDPGLGCQPAPPFRLEAWDAVLGAWVNPLELALFPADEQAQGLAVALECAIRPLIYWNGFISAVDETVSRQPGAMGVSVLIEAPVLGNA